MTDSSGFDLGALLEQAQARLQCRRNTKISLGCRMSGDAVENLRICRCLGTHETKAIIRDEIGYHAGRGTRNVVAPTNTELAELPLAKLDDFDVDVN